MPKMTKVGWLYTKLVQRLILAHPVVSCRPKQTTSSAATEKQRVSYADLSRLANFNHAIPWTPQILYDQTTYKLHGHYQVKERLLVGLRRSACWFNTHCKNTNTDGIRQL